ncbi:MAG: DUF2066 domain-containing protein [Woeseia sp.]
MIGTDRERGIRVSPWQDIFQQSVSRAAIRARFAAYIAVLLVPASFLLVATDVQAADATSVYTARVPVDSNNPQSRERAYEAALSQILLRITGSQNELLPEQVKELLPNPSRYVMQYRPGEDDTLWVTLDGQAIERELRQAGYTVWGGDRPLTLIWLAVDWGEGEREIVASDDPEQDAAEGRSIDRNRLLRERVQEVALARGVPVAFPLLDAQELETVSFSDIWGGFNDRLLEASRRYGANSILVGRVRPDTVERNRWSYFFGDEQREWTGEPEQVINLLADTLAAQFAISGNAPLESISLTVSGVDSIAAYGAVHSFIQSLDMIENLAIDSVSGNRIRYEVQAHGGRERLQRALGFSSILEVDDSFDRPISADSYPGPAALEYRYRPDRP